MLSLLFELGIYVHRKDMNRQIYAFKTVTHRGHMTWAERVKDELMQNATCFLSFVQEFINAIAHNSI